MMNTFHLDMASRISSSLADCEVVQISRETSLGSAFGRNPVPITCSNVTELNGLRDRHLFCMEYLAPCDVLST